MRGKKSQEGKKGRRGKGKAKGKEVPGVTARWVDLVSLISFPVLFPSSFPLFFPPFFLSPRPHSFFLSPSLRNSSPFRLLSFLLSSSFSFYEFRVLYKIIT